MNTYRRNPNTAGRLLGDRAFIITADQNRLVTLNTTASALWMLAEQGFTMEQAVNTLTTRFEVSEDQARVDLPSSLDDLVEKQVLVTD